MFGRIAKRLPRSARGRFAVAALLVLLVSAAAGWKWVLVSWKLRAARQAFAEGRLTDALQQLQAAESLQPGRPEVLYLLARAYRRNDRLEDVPEYLDRALAGGWPAADVQRQRYLYLVQSGRFGRAERFLEESMKRGVDDELAEEIYEALAKGYLKTYRIGDALFCLKYWIDWKPRAVPPRLLLADIHERLEDHKSAVKEYREILKIDSRSAEAHQRLGMNLFVLQDFEGARRHFVECLEIQPDDVSSLVGKARCDRRLARTAAAVRQFDELLGRKLADPQRAMVLTELAEIRLRDERKPELAIKLLSEARRLMPHSHQVLAALATAYRKTGRSDLAEECEQKAAAGLKRLERLTDITRKLIQSPRDAELRFEAGKIFLEQGMKRAGAEWLATALLFNPRHRKAHLALAEYYDETGDRASARKHRKLAGASQGTPPGDGEDRR